MEQEEFLAYARRRLPPTRKNLIKVISDNEELIVELRERINATSNYLEKSQLRTKMNGRVKMNRQFSAML